jgi:predicted nucleic acid-binding protein
MTGGKTLLVDSGAWYALADRSDRHHRQAIEFYRHIFKDYQQLITTNLIIAETYTLIRMGLGPAPGTSFLNNLSASPRVMKVFSDQEIEENAQEIICRYKDQDFSYTDAVSFALMRRKNITQAFAFDQHFRTAGFEMVPDIK